MRAACFPSGRVVREQRELPQRGEPRERTQLRTSFLAPSQHRLQKIKGPRWIDFYNKMCCPHLHISLKLGETHTSWQRNRTFNLIWISTNFGTPIVLSLHFMGNCGWV